VYFAKASKFPHWRLTGLIGEVVEREENVGLQIDDLPQGRS
jgi:hypothetical protein